MSKKHRTAKAELKAVHRAVMSPLHALQTTRREAERRENAAAWQAKQKRKQEEQSK